MRVSVLTRAAVAAMPLAFVALAGAQSLNIDIDQPGGSPALGQGVPSSAFGAAAGQAGVWNSFSTSGPTPLVGLSGAATSATIGITSSSTSFSLLGFNNPANTGDIALLMNDASQIGTVVQGGSRTYEINGLINGQYALYTYTAPPQGALVSGETFVNVLGSVEGNQMASGSMVGNTFQLGVTHLIHNVNVLGGSITINFTDAPDGGSAWVGGFQLVLIPAPGALAVFALAGFVGTRRRRD